MSDSNSFHTIDQAWANLLRRRLQIPLPSHPIYELQTVDCSADVESYILTGQPELVLTKLGDDRRMRWRLYLAKGVFERLDGVPDVYEGFAALPQIVALRWARVLQATYADLAVYCGMSFPDGRTWPELLLMSDGHMSYAPAQGKPVRQTVSAATLEKLLECDGLPAYELLSASFLAVKRARKGFELIAARRGVLVSGVPGYAQHLHRHIEVVRPLLVQSGLRHRLHVLAMLENAGKDTLLLILHELCAISMSNPALVATAKHLLERCSVEIVEPLSRLCKSGGIEQRKNALLWLKQKASELDDITLENYVRNAAQNDKAQAIQALSTLWIQTAKTVTEHPVLAYELPVLPPAQSSPQQLGNLLGKFWADVRNCWHSALSMRGFKAEDTTLVPFVQADCDALFNYLVSPSWRPVGYFAAQPLPNNSGNYTYDALARLANQDGVTPVILMKTLVFMDENLTIISSSSIGVPNHFCALYHATGRPTLLELAMLLEAVGMNAASMVETSFMSERSTGSGWATEDVWPYYAHYAQVLADTLKKQTNRPRPTLEKAVRTLPALPSCVASVLFEQAISESVSLRSRAQELILKVPGAEHWMVSALRFEEPKKRLWAAQWLQRKVYTPAIADLTNAFVVEKHDDVREAILDALLNLGEPIDAFVSCDSLAAGAQRGSKRASSTALSWVSWDELPVVKWVMNEQATVGIDILQYLVVQAYDRKCVKPSLSIRATISLFEASSINAFIEALFHQWLTADQKTIPMDATKDLSEPSQAATDANANTSRAHLYFHVTEAQPTEQFQIAQLTKQTPSLAPSIGVLSLVAICGSQTIVDPVVEYINRWYGGRMHQSTAMLKLLAWLEHKAAWLALLCIARNFKTKGLQKVALEEAELLATRQGWHVNELWDRMIDSAGLDEQSRFELAHTPHGPWTAQLISSLNWTLRTPAGEPAEVSTLALSFDLDSTQRDAALKRWDETKRSVAAVIRQQKQRLDEAFYTMREWRVGIWRETFFNHPIARFLVQGVVWTVRTSAETAHAVWPADNGVFLDEKGTQLHFEDSDRISISYANDGSDFSANYWCRNFASRKQKPLLRQFGLVTVKNVALEDSRCLIYNAKGSTVCAQSLERAAKKMNYSHRYTRGLGWGPTLIKEWPAAKLLAAIELEGIWYGVQGQEIRLGHLFFLPMGRLPHWRTPLISIDNVPTPLLARCVLDFQQFAALQRSETPS